MSSNRFIRIFAFIRRHWWRFLAAGLLSCILVLLIVNIPNFIVGFGKIGTSYMNSRNDSEDSSSEVSSEENSAENKILAPPDVYIISPKGLYSSIGFVPYGAKVGQWILAGFDTTTGIVTWINDDGTTFSVSSRARLLRQ